MLPMVSAPERAGDEPHSLASIERAKRILGWKPAISLEKGIREIVPQPFHLPHVRVAGISAQA
jgi:nucleoside-diphosphate-sugar epimerase